MPVLKKLVAGSLFKDSVLLLVAFLMLIFSGHIEQILFDIVDLF